jgi:outer membrane protein
VDVRRDQQVIAIRRQNYDAIAAQLREIEARQSAGELTRTDVAQAHAQLFAERANVETAENQLRTSEIAYGSIVGHNPGQLEPESRLPNLPLSAKEAWDIAGQNSPEFQQALFNELQSRSRLAEARTSSRPTISVQASAGYTSQLIPFATQNFDRSFVAQITLSQPLFTSGYARSVIRQAQEQNEADRLGIEAARRSMIQATSNAWNQVLTQRRNIETQGLQRDAADLAFRGTRVEYRAGERSTLDVLIAEEVLRDTELAQLNAMHDSYLNEALLLRYIGRLDAADIIASLPRYDPANHFKSIEHKGAMPWEPLVRMLDGIQLALPRQNYIPAPIAATKPSMGRGDNLPPGTQPIARVPITSVPGTVGGMPAPALEANDGDSEP